MGFLLQQGAIKKDSLLRLSPCPAAMLFIVFPRCRIARNESFAGRESFFEEKARDE